MANNIIAKKATPNESLYKVALILRHLSVLEERTVWRADKLAEAIIHSLEFTSKGRYYEVEQ